MEKDNTSTLIHAQSRRSNMATIYTAYNSARGHGQAHYVVTQRTSGRRLAASGPRTNPHDSTNDLTPPHAPSRTIPQHAIKHTSSNTTKLGIPYVHTHVRGR